MSMCPAEVIEPRRRGTAVIHHLRPRRCSPTANPGRLAGAPYNGVGPVASVLAPAALTGWLGVSCEQFNGVCSASRELRRIRPGRPLSRQPLESRLRLQQRARPCARASALRRCRASPAGMRRQRRSRPAGAAGPALGARLPFDRLQPVCHGDREARRSPFKLCYITNGDEVDQLRLHVVVKVGDVENG